MSTYDDVVVVVIIVGQCLSLISHLDNVLDRLINIESKEETWKNVLNSARTESSNPTLVEKSIFRGL